MEKNKLQVVCELYASLNKDYTSLGSRDIGYSSQIGEEQSKRLNKVWREVEKELGIYIPEK